MANLLSHLYSDQLVPSSGPNLILVGFMGTGKTTLGKRVAQKLGFPFLDTDELIEAKAGKPIPEIFASEGEEAFREMERRAVEEWIPASGAVISCGGGLVTVLGRIELLKSRGVVICLFASAETILQRVGQGADRPLLQGPDRLKRIEELLETRLPYYKKAGVGVITDKRSEAEVVEAILRAYRREAEGFQSEEGFSYPLK